MTFKGPFQPELFYDSTTNTFNFSSVLLRDPTVSPSGSHGCTLGASHGNAGNCNAVRPLAPGSIGILGLCITQGVHLQHRICTSATLIPSISSSTVQMQHLPDSKLRCWAAQGCFPAHFLSLQVEKIRLSH